MEMSVIQQQQQHPSVTAGSNSEWLNVCFDMFDIFQFAFNQSDGGIQDAYHYLEEILIGPKCEVRKIFSMQQNPQDEVFIPKKYNFVGGVNSRTILIDSRVYDTDSDADSGAQGSRHHEENERRKSTGRSPHTGRQSSSSARPKSNERRLSSYAFGSSFAKEQPQEQIQQQQQPEKVTPKTARGGRQSAMGIKPLSGSSVAPPKRRAVSSNAYVPKSKRAVSEKKSPAENVITASNIAERPHMVKRANSVQHSTTTQNTRYGSGVPSERAPEPSPRSHSVSAVRGNRTYDASQYQDNEGKRRHGTLAAARAKYASQNSGLVSSPRSNNSSTHSSGMRPSNRRSTTNRSSDSSSSPSDRLFEALQILEHDDQSLIKHRNRSIEDQRLSYHSPAMSPASPRGAVDSRNVLRSGSQLGYDEGDIPEMRSPIPSRSPKPPKGDLDDEDSFNSSDEEEQDGRGMEHTSPQGMFSPQMTPDARHSHSPSRYQTSPDGDFEDSSRTLFDEENEENDDSVLREGNSREDEDVPVVQPQRSASPTPDQDSDDDQASSDTDEEFPIHHSGETQDADRTSRKSMKQNSHGNDQENKENMQEVSLLFDPLFQCYYDPKSNKYFLAKE